MSDDDGVVRVGRFLSNQVLMRRCRSLEQSVEKISTRASVLKSQLNEYEDLLRASDSTAQKFYELDKFICNSSSIIDIFDGLFGKIEEVFRVNNVWIVFVDEGAYVSDVRKYVKFEQLYTRMCFCPQNDLLSMLCGNAKPVLVNQNLALYRKSSPVSIKHFIKSMALIPLVIDGEIIGSLNFGYHTKHRFSPDLDSIFLEMLGLKISFAIKMFLKRDEKAKIISIKNFKK